MTNGCARTTRALAALAVALVLPLWAGTGARVIAAGPPADASLPELSLDPPYQGAEFTGWQGIDPSTQQVHGDGQWSYEVQSGGVDQGQEVQFRFDSTTPDGLHPLRDGAHAMALLRARSTAGTNSPCCLYQINIYRFQDSLHRQLSDQQHLPCSAMGTANNVNDAANGGLDVDLATETIRVTMPFAAAPGDELRYCFLPDQNMGFPRTPTRDGGSYAITYTEPGGSISAKYTVAPLGTTHSGFGSTSSYLRISDGAVDVSNAGEAGLPFEWWNTDYTVSLVGAPSTTYGFSLWPDPEFSPTSQQVRVYGNCFNNTGRSCPTDQAGHLSFTIRISHGNIAADTFQFVVVASGGSSLESSFHLDQPAANAVVAFTVADSGKHRSNVSRPRSTGTPVPAGGRTLPVPANGTHPLSATSSTPTVPTHVAPSAATATRPAATCTVWTDAHGDASDLVTGGNDPQLDLISGELGLSSDRRTLRVIIHVANLPQGSVNGANLPTGATEMMWRTSWTSSDGLVFFAEADISLAVPSAVRYSDGQVIDLGPGARAYLDKHHDDTGSISPGAPATVEVDVPLAHVGDPRGALRTPMGEAAEWIGLPTWLGTSSDSTLYDDRVGTDHPVDTNDRSVAAYNLDTGRC